MGKVGSTLLKVAVLVGGAVAGAIAGRFLDEALVKRSAEQSEYDRTRYEQGLGPVSLQPPPVMEEQQQ